MRYKKILFHAVAIGLIIGGSISCKRDLVFDSTPVATSLPFVVTSFVEPFYVTGVGSGAVNSSIPDTIALVADTLVGFEGGFGGKTGKDSFYIMKSDITGWPDTVAAGGYSIKFQKFNTANFKIVVSSSVVIAAPIESPSVPGPTDLAGDYERTSNGYIIDIVKVFDGVYVIANPGGAGVALQPYLFYNYKDVNGNDSLSFPCQPNPCGGGTKLVDPGAPAGLTNAEYDASYPPAIISSSPFTLQWKVFEFPDTDPATAHPGIALCQWGLSVRTFVKQ